MATAPSRQPRLLLVEDSVSFAHCIKAKLQRDVDAQIVLARSLAEAREAIEVFGADFFLAILDLTLPDASGDEIVELVASKDIASIVFTGTYSDDLSDRLYSLGAIDYLIKDSPHSLNYMVSLVRRLRANVDTTALVVDDSATSRKLLSDLLRNYRFRVLEAKDGVDALAVIEQNPSVKLVIADYNMPKMNGCDLTRAIRRKAGPDQIAVIGISAQGSGPLSAQFIKFGANDFLTKPFLREEFFCRITQNMNLLDQVQMLSTAALRDSLTGLSNRRHFFDTLAGPSRSEAGDPAPFSVGMIDIDLFKTINDTYGHAAGDDAIRHVAEIVEREARHVGGVVGRIGGEEFGVFLENTTLAAAAPFFEAVRDAVARSSLAIGDKREHLTVSIGVADGIAEDGETVLNRADTALYAAKAGGRDRVWIAEGEATEIEEALFL